MVEGENRCPQVVLYPPHVYTHTQNVTKGNGNAVLPSSPGRRCPYSLPLCRIICTDSLASRAQGGKRIWALWPMPRCPVRPGSEKSRTRTRTTARRGRNSSQAATLISARDIHTLLLSCYRASTSISCLLTAASSHTPCSQRA